MKKIITFILGLGILCTLTACGGNSSSSSSSSSTSSSTSSSSSSGSSTSVKTGTYSISVYDLDDELLGEATIDFSEYETFYEALDGEFELVAPDSTYGHYITSINGSIVDPNWSMMVYVNGQQATVGIDDLEPAANDEIVIKNECWAAVDYGYGVSMDAYDVLVDKAVYHYIKTILKEKVESITTYSGSTYWEMLSINLMKTYNYDSSLFEFNYTTELQESITSANVSSLTGANWGKYYSHAKQLGLVTQDFIDAYTTFVNDTMDETMNQYTTPFYTFPAKQIGITSEKFTTISNSTLGTDMSWGPDGAAWQLICQAMWNNTYTTSDLTAYVSDWGNAASNAVVLECFAALNVNVRDEAFATLGDNNDKDLIEVIFDKYYDNEQNLVKVYTSDSGTNMATNQVYAGLIAHKVYRDQYTKAAVNIFGATAAA